jgi:hypothetical protein
MQACLESMREGEEEEEQEEQEAESGERWCEDNATGVQSPNKNGNVNTWCGMLTKQDSIEKMDEGGRAAEQDHMEITRDGTQSPQHKSCWLCEYHGNPACDRATTFVVDSIAHMSFANLVTQLHGQITAAYPSENVSRKQITTHIREHMLHPRIKLAIMMHRLSDMQGSITQNITSEDTETGQTVIDASVVKLYAALSNQMASLYKMDEDKLMFRNMSMDK